MFFGNLKLLFKSYFSIGIGIIFGILLFCFFEFFTERGILKGNFGDIFSMINLFLDLISSIFFGLFISTVVFKFKYFSVLEKKIGIGIFGSLLSSLFTGCASCSITFATYLGLGSILTLLPYSGIELKILGLLILIYSIYKNIKTLNICELKKK